MRFLIACALVFSSVVFADTIAGVSKGETFGFTTYPDKITGTWGDKVYDISFYNDEWKGKVGGKEFDLQFWNPDISGNLPCGDVKIGQWSTELEGIVCGESFVTTTGSQRNSDLVGYDTVVSALIAEFPIPTQGLMREQFDWNRPK